MAIFSKKKTTDETQKPAAKSMQELYAGEAATKSSSKTKTTKIKLRPGSQSYRVLVRPVVTEKAAALNGLRQYAFVVSPDANKVMVAKAIGELYGIKPLKVNIFNMTGKRKARGRIMGKRKDWRKAIVTLPEGAALDVYEGV